MCNMQHNTLHLLSVYGGEHIFLKPHVCMLFVNKKVLFICGLRAVEPKEQSHSRQAVAKAC
jgi:hypothetical protein